ncbi:hypothetical protein UFOVP178_60 [uncultured Caudovirales phage]|uniref:Uncharacterized protein n=1 Tax=uncultured Caudovirales phage TaxID=2100421 RepID=A0A6J7WBZ7_9CAUD|nr:hypothetical protein UFOVP178_60 [uncultured Caudovirales phage]
MSDTKRGPGRPKVARPEKITIRPQRINPTAGKARAVSVRLAESDLAGLEQIRQAQKLSSTSAVIRWLHAFYQAHK